MIHKQDYRLALTASVEHMCSQHMYKLFSWYLFCFFCKRRVLSDTTFTPRYLNGTLALFEGMQTFSTDAQGSCVEYNVGIDETSCKSRCSKSIVQTSLQKEADKSTAQPSTT